MHFMLAARWADDIRTRKPVGAICRAFINWPLNLKANRNPLHHYYTFLPHLPRTNGCYANENSAYRDVKILAWQADPEVSARNVVALLRTSSPGRRCVLLG